MEYKGPKVGAGVVIIKNGKTLLAKRKGSHGEGMWGTMGGHVEFGESPIEAVKREAREELGIEIGNLNIDVSFTGELVSGEPAICEPDKIESIGWYPLSDLPQPLFDPVRIVLESLKTGRSYFEVKQ